MASARGTPGKASEWATAGHILPHRDPGRNADPPREVGASAPLSGAVPPWYGVVMGEPAPLAWDLDPLLLVTVAVVAATLAWLLGRVAARGSSPGRWRLASAAVGTILLCAALVSPLATLAAHYLLTAHQLQVTLLMGFVPPLVLLSLPPGTAAATAGRRSLWVGAARSTVHPAVAIVLVNTVFFAWHVPQLYQAALDRPALYGLQQISLLLVALAFWWPIVEPWNVQRRSMSPLLKLGYILLATIPQTFAGLVFALAHRPFYRGYHTSALGLSPLDDQQIAGACMALVSKIALFAAFSVVLWQVLAPAASDGEGDGGGGGGQGSDEPLPAGPGTPEWLRLLETGPMADEPQPTVASPSPVPAEATSLG